MSRLSEMSDAELKEYYRAKDVEKERRERVKRQMAREEPEYIIHRKQLEIFREELNKMSYEEINRKYFRDTGVMMPRKAIGNAEEQCIIYDVLRKKRTPEIAEREYREEKIAETILTILYLVVLAIFIPMFFV